jgi:hypothetical protein
MSLPGHEGQEEADDLVADDLVQERLVLEQDPGRRCVETAASDG